MVDWMLLDKVYTILAGNNRGSSSDPLNQEVHPMMTGNRLTDEWNVIFAVIFFLLETSVGVLFVYIAIKCGFVDRKIIGNFAGDYLTGKSAVARGILFLILGGICLFGSIGTGIFLYRRLH